MARSEDKLRTVRLQIIDEITGEPLEHVNVRTNAKSVSLSNGDFLEDVIVSLKQNLGTVQVSDARLRAALEEHLASNLHADASKLHDAFIGLEVNEKTGVARFLRYDGTYKEWDTALEKVPLQIKLDKKTNELVIITEDNPEGLRVDFSKFVDLFEGEKTDDTTTKVTSENHILVHINKKAITQEHLSEDLAKFVKHLEDFLDKYEDKIEKIEDEANNYTLPPASSTELGGIIPGFGLETDKDGVAHTTNVKIGSSLSDASPCGMFLEVCNIGGPSTDPIPVMENGKSYITAEGNIIEYNDETGIYTYTNCSTDGTVEYNLSKEQVSEKFINGLELLDLDDIMWYYSTEDPDSECAILPNGDGFVYTLSSGVKLFVGYIDTSTFIKKFNAGELVEKSTEDSGGEEVEEGTDEPTENETPGNPIIEDNNGENTDDNSDNETPPDEGDQEGGTE